MYILNKNLVQSNFWDRAGISASFLCILHCLITPFLITLIPIVSATESETHKGIFHGVSQLDFLFQSTKFGMHSHAERGNEKYLVMQFGFIVDLP